MEVQRRLHEQLEVCMLIITTEIVEILVYLTLIFMLIMLIMCHYLGATTPPIEN